MPSTHPDEQQLACSLIRLARSGAYAKPAAEHAGCDFHVLSPRNAFAAPIAHLPGTAVTHAIGLGWLTAAPDGTVRLSRAGSRAVKRAMAPLQRPTCKQPLKATTARMRGSTTAGTARQPQRIEGPLLWLRNRRDRNGTPLITQAQFEAGERFAADYARAQLRARITASWSATAPCLRSQSPGTSVDITDAAMAARDRLHRAMLVVGPEMGQLLIDVCCNDIGLEAAERARHWPVRSGKVVLDMGLTALARHYGLEAAPNPQQAPATPRRWTATGYKPTLDAWI